jgi:DNA-binding transcriptional ArsR family regulator
MAKELCETKGADMERVSKAAANMARLGTYQAAADIFGVLGDVTRVRILDAISREELCVCDISALIEMSPSAVSHHLRTLRNLRLVRHRRAGKKVHYALRDSHVKLLLSQALNHVRHR